MKSGALLCFRFIFLCGGFLMIGTINPVSVYACPGCPGMAGAPVVTGISAPAEMEIGKAYPVTLTYHDDDGDAVSAIITQGGFAISALAVPDGTDGSVATSFTCTEAGQSMLFGGSVTDAMNNTGSSSQAVRATCVASSDTPVPPVSPPSTPSTPFERFLLSGVGGGVNLNGSPAQDGATVNPGANIKMSSKDAQLKLNYKCGQAALVVALYITVMEAIIDPDNQESVAVIFHIIFYSLLQACYEPGSVGAAAAGGPLALEIDLQNGGFKLQGQYENLNLKITTPHASVSSSGKNTFSVGYNPATGQTLVEANSGNVDVQPGGSGERMVTLRSGQQVIVDQSGNAGQTTSIGQTPSPTTGGSSLKNFDKNKNNMLDNDEFFAVVDAWISGQIDNAMFFKAVDLWISQGQITAAAVVKEPVRLSISKTTVPTKQLMIFQAQGQPVADLDVAIFDLQGHEVFRQDKAGSALSWDLLADNGRAIANGVYLCEIIARGDHGQIVFNEVEKVLVAR
ncbi:hypothetical protein HYR53_10605 [Candidatus Acetothermia bacterium]|nr:hypothetical protein [Candidatus Acetothermia bacterium]